MVEHSLKITAIFFSTTVLIIATFFKGDLASVGHMTLLRLIRSIIFSFISLTLLQAIYVYETPSHISTNIFKRENKMPISFAISLIWFMLYTVTFSQIENFLSGDIGNYYLVPTLLFCSSVLGLNIIAYTNFKIVGCVIYSLFAFFLILTAVFFAVYFYLYGQLFDEYALLCVIATNFDEVINYLSATFTPLQLAFFVVLVLLLFFTILQGALRSVKQNGIKTYKPRTMFYGFIVIGYLCYYLCSVFPLDQWLHLYRLGGPMNAFIQLQQNIESNANKIVLGKEVFKSNKEKGTVVLVIGESACRDRMSAFYDSYPINTTPWEKEMVKNDNFIFFKNAYSCFSNTVMAVTQALTSSNQYNGVLLKDATDIINVAKKRGYKTYWFSTQNKSTVSDAGITVLANQADKVFWMKGFDEAIIEQIKCLPVNENKFIVIQLTGSHFNYNRRVPEKFMQANNLVSISKNDKTKWYEYSLMYTDEVLKRIFTYFKDNHDLQVMVYLSDHGEDMKYTHTASPFLFNMVRIPLWVYFSPDYQRNNPNLINGLKVHKEAFFTNDLLFETLSGIMNAQHNSYEDIYDLSSNNYMITKDNALTMHGKKRIKDDEIVRGY